MRPSLVGCIALSSTLVLACTDASAPTAPTVGLEPTSGPTADLVTNFTVPYHSGAVRFYKEVGIWTAKHEARTKEICAEK